MQSSLRSSAALLASCLFFGCSESVVADPEFDAGSNPTDSGLEPGDAGGTVDSGDEGDSGDERDSGEVVDAGDAVDAGYTVDAGGGTDAGGGMDAGPACDVGGAITRVFTIRSARLAPAGTGANLDGRDDSGSGSSIPGCLKQDAAGGVDNRAYVLDGATGGLVSSSAQAGLNDGSTTLAFTLSNWNGTTDDPCIDLTITANGLVGPATSRTSIANSTIDVADPDRGWNATDGRLTIPIRGLHVHLVLDAPLTDLRPLTNSNATTSYVAGHILYVDASAAAAAHDGRRFVHQFIDSEYAGSPFQSVIRQQTDGTAFGARDLHTTGGLRPCESTGSSTVDADSISGAFQISTLLP